MQTAEQLQCFVLFTGAVPARDVGEQSILQSVAGASPPLRGIRARLACAFSELIKRACVHRTRPVLVMNCDRDSRNSSIAAKSITSGS